MSLDEFMDWISYYDLEPWDRMVDVPLGTDFSRKASAEPHKPRKPMTAEEIKAKMQQAMKTGYVRKVQT